MLKWTASAQKLAQHTPNANTTTVKLPATPRYRETNARRRRRATIANKENIPYTSTPLVPRMRNSPLVLAPLTDIRNITPECLPAAQTTPTGRRRVATTVTAPRARRHSTLGFNIPLAAVPQYASTLPRYEEEYSPSAALPTGQQLALRGLLPQPFLGNARYFNTPELAVQRSMAELEPKALPPQKRKLAQEFAQIAQEEASSGSVTLAQQQSLAQYKTYTLNSAKRQAVSCTVNTVKQPHLEAANTNTLNSAKMGDQTLDRLIDAILDSARKDEKKKKPRKSFNLRRRTLLKQQVESAANQQVLPALSPSYAAGDDPASDLSFLLLETTSTLLHQTNEQVYCAKSAYNYALPATPAPATPLPGTPIPTAVLQQLPTPAPASPFTLNCQLARLRAAQARKNDSFGLDTPVRRLTKKRRQHHLPEMAPVEVSVLAAKKFKVDARNYFEVGLALPSIYV